MSSINRNITNFVFRLLGVFGCCLLLGAAYGQNNPNLERIRADEAVVGRVQEEINKHRLLMLMKSQWGLPTDEEEKRLKKAKYNRYTFDSLNMIHRNDLQRRSGRQGIYRNLNDIWEEQNVVVFGWYMSAQPEADKRFNFNLLKHVAYHSYKFNTYTGGYRNYEDIFNFKNGFFVPTAHADTCKVLLTVSSHGEASNAVFLGANPWAQKNLIDSLLVILEISGADGIDLNFEEVPIAYKTEFIEFVKELSFNVREANTNYTISMSVPILDKENVYDLSELKPWVDLFIIQGYNFHISPTGLVHGPLSPLSGENPRIKGSYFVYKQIVSLAQLLRIDAQQPDRRVAAINLLHHQEYVTMMSDTIDKYIQRSDIAESVLEEEGYDPEDFSSIYWILRRFSRLQQIPSVRYLLDNTKCEAELYKEMGAAEQTTFFLFRPNADTFYVKEYDIFNNNRFTSRASTELPADDIQRVIERYKREIGTDQSSSLILGLPYYGAIWNEKNFEGYISYSQIRQLMRSNAFNIHYDKTTNSMVGYSERDIIVQDTVGERSLVSFQRLVRDVFFRGRTIYFDNSTTMTRKIDYALDQNLGGVGLWAVGYDHNHNELWATLEDNFAKREMVDEETGVRSRFAIAKSNKIHFTIQYNVRRNSAIVLLTLAFIVIVMTIGFTISLLDWKVRDVLFYSGAFRLFYLTIFTIMVIMFGSYVGLFESMVVTFGVGILLGAFLIWVSSVLVQYRHSKLP